MRHDNRHERHRDTEETHTQVDTERVSQRTAVEWFGRGETGNEEGEVLRCPQ